MIEDYAGGIQPVIAYHTRSI